MLTGGLIRGILLTALLHENGDNHAVHTEHTSHDDGNDRSEEELGLEDGHGDDTDARLGSTVGGTEVSEDEGSGDAHGSEEDSLVRVAKIYPHANKYKSICHSKEQNTLKKVPDSLVCYRLNPHGCTYS